MSNRSVCIAAVLSIVCGFPQQITDSGPTSLVILYHCAPAQRTELRQKILQSGLRNFESFEAQGILANYRILFSRYADTNNWDMLAVLTFSNYTNAAAWKKIERSTPGGLGPDTLALVTAINTYPVDRMRWNSAATGSTESVFLVVPYTYAVPPQGFLRYVDSYLAPQFDGWIAEGALSGYNVFIQRYTASRPWDSLMLLEYKDDESLGARERIAAKVRQQLQGNGDWKAVNESSDRLPVEREAIVADELAFRH